MGCRASSSNEVKSAPQQQLDATRTPEEQQQQEQQVKSAPQQQLDATRTPDAQQQQEQQVKSAPQDLEAMSPSIVQAIERLNTELGERPRICILGGTNIMNEGSAELIALLAKELARTIDDHALFITGGMAGVQQTFADSFAIGKNLRHMLPVGEASNFEFGTDICVGKDLDDRKLIFGNIGDVYITAEGGPGVAQEARSAARMGAFIVPLVRTGGASGGKFGFPPQALEKPDFSTAEEWDLLCSSSVELPDSARAAAAIVARCVSTLENQRRCSRKKAGLGGTALWEMEASTFDAVDADGDGTLSKDELEELLRKLNPAFCKVFAAGIYDTMSHHGKDKVTIDCFREWLHAGTEAEGRDLIKRHMEEDAQLLPLFFKALDRHGTGHVGGDEVVRILEKLGNPDVEVSAFFEAIDADRNGQIDFDEFVHMLHEASEKRKSRSRVVTNGSFITRSECIVSL